MTYHKLVYVCGDCHDCAYVYSEEPAPWYGIPCVLCDNTIWFDEVEPDRRLGDLDVIEEYGVSEAFNRLDEPPAEMGFTECSECGVNYSNGNGVPSRLNLCEDCYRVAQ